MARSASTSRRRRSSSCSSCSARCSSCARAAARARRSGTCWDSRPRPRGALRQDGSEQDVPLEHVQVGDRLRVRPGEQVPSTASCSKAQTTVDESMVTGEPIPVEKAPDAHGDRRHRQRHRHVRDARPSASAATRCSRRSSGWSARRSGRRAPIQRLADTVSGWFVPASWSSRSSPSSSGRLSGPSRGWRTRWSMPSRS